MKERNKEASASCWPFHANHGQRPGHWANGNIDQHVSLAVLRANLPPDEGGGKDRQDGIGQEPWLDHHLNDFVHRLNRPLFGRVQHDDGGANQAQRTSNLPISVKLFFQENPRQHSTIDGKREERGEREKREEREERERKKRKREREKEREREEREERRKEEMSAHRLSHSCCLVSSSKSRTNLMTTLRPPMGVTRIAGANEYAAKFAISPTAT